MLQPPEGLTSLCQQQQQLGPATFNKAANPATLSSAAGWLGQHLLQLRRQLQQHRLQQALQQRGLQVAHGGLLSELNQQPHQCNQAAQLAWGIASQQHSLHVHQGPWLQQALE